MDITVLLADDHAVLRDGLKYLLEAQQDIHVVGTAATGREAINLATKLQPDVVVMDISMPEMNGIDAARQIRESCPATQVVILSIHATAEYIFRALQAGALGYLLKESAGVEVVTAVRSVSYGHRYLSQKITETVIDDYSRQNRNRSPLESLSQRERQIIQWIAASKSGAEIAGLLGVSPKTVETYRSRAMRKLGINDLQGLVKFAVQHGLAQLD